MTPGADELAGRLPAPTPASAQRLPACRRWQLSAEGPDGRMGSEEDSLAWLVNKAKAGPKDSWVVGVSFKKKAAIFGGPRDGDVLRPEVVHART